MKAKAPMYEFLETIRTTLDELPLESTTSSFRSESDNLRYQLMHIKDVLERWKIVGLNRKLQIKPRKFQEYQDENGVTKERCIAVQLILKWVSFVNTLGTKLLKSVQGRQLDKAR